MFFQRRTEQQSQETNMARSAHQKIIWSVRTDKRTDIRRKQYITTCKEWMLILQLQRRYNNIISCLNLYSSCIKKMINPDGRRFSAVIYTTRCNVRPSEHQICMFSEPLLGFSPINLNPFTFPYISFQIQIL